VELVDLEPQFGRVAWVQKAIRGFYFWQKSYFLDVRVLAVAFL